MIRIERGPEPASLPPVRARELARVSLLHAAGPFDSKAIGDAYTVVKHELWSQQFMHCCYCEMQVQRSFNDVEHFRPKACADRTNGTVDNGYWWLTWTWENLLFTCPNCNRSGKNDAFPLETGSVSLLPGEQPPGKELSTLIDPCAEEPVELIQFVFDGRHWRPVGRNGSQRGQRTVELLKLDRSELLDHYNVHVTEFVHPRTGETLEAIARKDEEGARLSWRRVIRGLLSPRMSFIALSYDAIDHFVPQDIRERWQLEWPRPPVRGP